MIKKLEKVLNSAKCEFVCHEVDSDGQKAVAIQIVLNGKDFCVVGLLAKDVPELIRILLEEKSACK